MHCTDILIKVDRVSHVRSHTTDGLETPISPQRTSLDFGRKPDYPEEETHEIRGEHADSMHTGSEVGLEPATLEVTTEYFW